MAASREIYRKEKDAVDWDDTLLIAAYDKAMAKAKDKSRKKPVGVINGASMLAPCKKEVRGKPSKWEVGDFCQAVFSEDGMLYEARIVDMSESTRMCTVEFLGYENVEDINMSDIRPSQGKSSRAKQIQAARYPSTHQWKAGDVCKARYYEDGLVYEATITEVYEKDGMCVVKFLGYENEEEVDLGDLEPIGRKLSNRDTSEVIYDKVADGASSCSSDPSSLSTLEDVYSGQESKHHSPRAPPACYAACAGGGCDGGPCGFPPKMHACEPNFLPNEHLPFAANDVLDGGSDDLGSMLIAWYMAGYHTGYYQGRHSRDRSRDRNQRHGSGYRHRPKYH